MPKGPAADDVRAALAAAGADAGQALLPDASVEQLLNALVADVVRARRGGTAPARPALKLVVRELARRLAEGAPGRSVEVRIPPYAAVQCLAGPRHTRGTPPNVVEADPVAFVDLCAGLVPWSEAVSDGRVRASGERSNLSALLPLDFARPDPT